MTRALTRTNFHSSRLVRLLSDLTVLVPVEPGMAFAEKFSQWMPLSDAITLRAAHNASPAGPAAGTPLAARAALGEAFTRMRALWEKGITQPDVPAPLLGEPLDVRAVYEPYRRYYLAHQRDMELQLRPWRTKVRNELAKASPALRQLASLDSALDGILAARESKLFSTIPALLEKRFTQLHEAHQQRLVDTHQADHPDFWMKPGGWLARFGHELQTVLLAELDLRLQPTQGLLEAFHNEKTQ